MFNSLIFKKYSSLSKLATVAVAIVLSACGKQGFQMASVRETPQVLKAIDEVKESDKIALLVPLSGQHRSLGKSLQRAAEMSLFDHAGDKINLATYDTRSSRDGAIAAAQRAIKEGAGIIVGPVFSSHAEAVAQIARSNRINVVSFSNNKNLSGSGVFVMGFSPEEQIRTIVKYAVTRGIRSIAVVQPRNAYGSVVENEVKSLQSTLGFDVEFVSYNTNLNTLDHDLEPLKTLKVDAIFIPEGGKSLSKIISMMLYREISLAGVQMLGTGQWDEVRALQNVTLQGAWIAVPDPSEKRSFNVKYTQAYGSAPDRIATLAYDSIAMLAVLKKHYGDKAFSFSALTHRTGFDGVDGVFKLRPDGVAERKLTISEVRSNGLMIMQRASSF